MEKLIRELEERLLEPAVRGSAQDVAMLLADVFLEFGSSGRVYDKQQVIEALQRGPDEQISIEDFRVRVLAPGVVLATYRSVRSRESKCALSCSIWKFENERWRMAFHQGTPTGSK